MTNADRARDELKKEIGWDLVPVRQTGDPKNDDFIEADISKILQRERKMLARINELARESGIFCQGNCRKIEEYITEIEEG